MIDLGKKLIARGLMLDLGLRVIFVIRQRTLRGEFLPGSTGTSSYSTTPAPLPLGALPKRAQSRAASMAKRGDAALFTSKRGTVWIVLKEGYKQLRELAGRETDRVTLNWSGKMMRNLKVLDASHAGTVTLGFSDKRSAEIARYHQEEGAGKSRKTHKFLGLTPGELSDLGDFAESIIYRNA